jgi:NADH-quinone oxidoreductase subunit C
MANKDVMIEKLRSRLGDNAVCVDDKFGAGVVSAATVPATRLLEILGSFKETGFFLETMTALDFQDTQELVYHLNCYEPKSRMSLRVLVEHGASMPSASGVFTAADWLEREVREFYGIQFDGHPDPRNLLLPEDADYHPLKKEFGKVHAYRTREEIYG